MTIVFIGDIHQMWDKVEDGLQSLGVAAAWGVTATGDVLWEGEAPRHLTASPAGWKR